MTIGYLPTKFDKVDRKSLVGEKVVFYNKELDKYYDIDILEYLKGSHPRFKIKYKNEEIKDIQCSNFINSCKISDIINGGANKFYKKDNYYVMTIKVKGTINENLFNEDYVEVLFDGNDEVVNSIKNTTWCVGKGNSKDGFYIQTSNYDNKNINAKLHQVVYGKVSSMNVVDHINSDRLDNRLYNLREVSRLENSRNKSKSGYPTKKDNGWYLYLCINGNRIHSPLRRTYEQADIDALIIQKHFQFRHREHEWYKIDNVDKNYRSKLIGLMENKLNKKKSKGIIFQNNKYEIAVLCEEECIKVYDNKDRYTFISKEDLYILNLGRVCLRNDGYWGIVINGKSYMLHRYILGIKDMTVTEIQVDHINHKVNDNRKSNLIITTKRGNLSNKDSKGYCFQDPCYYMVYYNCYWHYISKHKDINKTKKVCFLTEIESKNETLKRKWLANYIKPKFGNYQDYLSFKLNNQYNDLDRCWIEVKFPDINTIKIPEIMIDFKE